MGLLDAIGGGGLEMMIPGANILSLVTKGLEMIKDLIDQGNTKGADAILGFLGNVLNEGSKDASGAAEPQPFTPPETRSGGPGEADGSPFSMQISIGAPQVVSHGGLPTVDGSPAGDEMLSQAASPFVEGTDEAKSRALTPGSSEWTSVMCAMQQNPNIQYNADTQRFFTQTADGSKLDVCSLQDVQSVIEQNGGYDRSNPTAGPAVGEFLKEKVGQAQQSPITATITLDIAKANRLGRGSSNEDPTVEDLNRQIEGLKRKIAEYEAARQVMNPAASRITMSVGV